MQGEEYCVQLESLKGKTHWDSKIKCNVPDLPKQDYLSKAVRSFYSNLKEANSDSQDIKNARKFPNHCLEKLENDDFEDGVA